MNQKLFEQAALPQITLLRSYALRLTMNSENAKDLLQETYLKAYKSWNNFEQGTNIRAWLYCIMKNSYINHYRKRIKEPNKVEYQEHHLPYSIPQEPTFGHIHLPEKNYKQIFGDEISCSIDSLKESFRNIIVLSDVEGHSYEEIAQIIGCPLGTVRSRLFRGRSELRKKLFKYAKNNRYILRESEI
jgi:RNA polymerase sigma factor (sigma-70 family)